MHFLVSALQSPFNTFGTFRASNNVYICVIYLTILLVAHAVAYSVKWWEDNELEGTRKEVRVAVHRFKVCPVICLEGLRRAKVGINRYPGRDNPGSPDDEADVLHT
jgi:hypothetical protein